ncbi:MAG: dihydrodipicolinate synthase family protein [Rhizobiales bacterium]|nr:dihydrodipicolinate synthase family protein [Hyphomicrobiales bacterium]
MKTDAITPADLQRSVLAVPPLPRAPDGAISAPQTGRLIARLAEGGVSTFMFGGNANLYNIGLGEYDLLLDVLESAAPSDGWIIPSVGADYGKALDQIERLRERAFPTAMLLPLAFPATRAGVATGLRRLADRYGRPLVAYMKDEGYMAPADIAALMRDGAVCALKYAVVRRDPSEDPTLAAILAAIGSGECVVSGIGERPAVAHLTTFGLAAFTSGSVCVAPELSTALLAALKAGRRDEADRIRTLFLPLEDLRDRLSPIRVLHAAVALAGIAETGPLAPFLSSIEDASDLAAIGAAARELSAASRSAGRSRAEGA